MKTTTYSLKPVVADGSALLHAGHFACMRAIVQGMEHRAAWQRYLRDVPGAGELATLDQAVAALRAACAAAARRQHRPGMARLLQRDLRAMAGGEDVLPSLADFAEAENLDGFSEAEQSALYALRFGARLRSQRRRQRLVARQLDALHWLQQQDLGLPRHADALADWLEPPLAARLAAAQVDSVGQLVARIERYGDRWHAGIAGLGTAGMQRIFAWHYQHRATLAADGALLQGLPLTAPVAIPVPLAMLAPALALVDFKRDLNVPACKCRLPVANDLEAMRYWLHQKAGAAKLKPVGASVVGALVTADAGPVPGWELLANLTHTQRAYWKEAERFQLWLLLERRSSLSGVVEADCAAYQDFIDNPPAHWCGPRGRDKRHPQWRPFEGPLGAAARRRACLILHGLYAFLVQAGYLRRNAWQQAPTPAEHVAMAPSQPPARQAVATTAVTPMTAPTKIAQPYTKTTRATSTTPVMPRTLTHEACQVLERTLAAQPACSVQARLQLAVMLLQASGATLRELVLLTSQSLRYRPQSQIWLLHSGAPGAGRTAALPPATIALLENYFASRGLNPALLAPTNRGVALLGQAADVHQRAPWVPSAQGSFDPRAGIAAGTLRDQFRSLFAQCAVVSAGNPAVAMQFAGATSRCLVPSPVRART